jgi:hypothetical protein
MNIRTDVSNFMALAGGLRNNILLKYQFLPQSCCLLPGVAISANNAPIADKENLGNYR